MKIKVSGHAKRLVSALVSQSMFVAVGKASGNREESEFLMRYISVLENLSDKDELKKAGWWSDNTQMEEIELHYEYERVK